jgi:hypothetical protein
VLVAPQASPLTTLTALWEADADVALVSRDPDGGRAADVVGVITQAALGRLLRTDENLS